MSYPSDLIDRWREQAIREGVSMSELSRRVLEEYLKNFKSLVAQTYGLKSVKQPDTVKKVASNDPFAAYKELVRRHIENQP